MGNQQSWGKTTSTKTIQNPKHWVYRSFTLDMIFTYTYNIHVIHHIDRFGATLHIYIWYYIAQNSVYYYIIIKYYESWMGDASLLSIATVSHKLILFVWFQATSTTTRTHSRSDLSNAPAEFWGLAYTAQSGAVAAVTSPPPSRKAILNLRARAFRSTCKRLQTTRRYRKHL